MKKILLSILTIVAVLHSVSASAQTATFSPVADTAYGQIQTNANIRDFITATATGGVTLTWKVVACNFPTDWLADSTFGICDNTLCHYNIHDTLWNGTTGVSTWTSGNYAQFAQGQFYLSMNMNGTVTNGTFYVTIQLLDLASNYSKNITFKVSKYATGVTTISRTTDEVTLYPNPATTEVNVLYSPDVNVKTIAIYNIIGKVVKVYNTLDNSSAKLNIDNIPSGIYFIRMMDGAGHVVATRKFTRQ